ncbi:MAG: glycosyltransferase family 4 protein [Adhaeribacter sp.]
MIKLVDLTYYAHPEFDKPEQVWDRHREALGFISFVRPPLQLEVIKHLNYEGTACLHGVKFSFFRKKNRFWTIPFHTHRYLARLKPDLVLVQGLIFPLQVLCLRLALGPGPKILVQHHGEQPFKGWRAVFQKLADRYIQAYLFTSSGNALPFMQANIISSRFKCYEVLEASTALQPQDKAEARSRLGISGHFNFLWVGRLNANKDPLTLLEAFGQYLQVNDQARLYLIYQEESLLPAVKDLVAQKPALQKALILVGRVPREQLATWYSAADYYVSASHQEGSGYALLEALACGCVPIVTDIPSFRRITGGGQFGYLYPAGNPGKLLACFLSLPEKQPEACSAALRRHFEKNLSFQAIARQLTALVTSLAAK